MHTFLSKLVSSTVQQNKSINYYLLYVDAGIARGIFLQQQVLDQLSGPHTHCDPSRRGNNETSPFRDETQVHDRYRTQWQGGRRVCVCVVNLTLGPICATAAGVREQEQRVREQTKKTKQ